ncbi:zf-HC2 domain-containing protein [Nocardia mexicana]|uniref:Putative zinc finger protein n=1 Tax=Nocardia mexicana TaxID=279262 RepID=A0A370HJI7_9NOCA|nr:zf-HC2 domain-containing protein [Nocardia mexicana]RDI55669.1 putative zinc finger protein [Nocardia mexicana]
MTAGSEWHGLSGAYVLDALTDAEQEVFERHLTWCSRCAQEVGELREVVVRLAECLACQPDPELRARILADLAE